MPKALPVRRKPISIAGNRPSRWPWLGPAALLLATTFVAYLPAMNAGLVFDDRQYLIENPLLTSWQGLWRMWVKPFALPQYYPLTFTTFWIERHLWPHDNWAGYHLVNIVLHAVNSILFWRILVRLRVPGAFLAAALFALHPVHVESVAWLCERKNVLSGALGLGALLTYLHYARFDQAPAVVPRRGALAVLSLLLFGGALLSKSSICVLPTVILLLLWWRFGRLSRRDLPPLALMFVLAVGMGVLTMRVENQVNGMEGFVPSYSLLEHLLIAGRIPWFYAGKLFWPAGVVFIYPSWTISTAAWWQFLYPAGAIAVIALLWALRRRIGAGPLIAVLIFGGALVPVLGFAKIAFMRFSFVADHFQYLPSLALIALAAAVLTRASAAVPGRFAKHCPMILGGVLLLTLGRITWQESTFYKDPYVFWQGVLKRNPGAWIAWTNLGREHLMAGHVQESLDCYRQAVEVNPDSNETQCEMGSALYYFGKLEDALTYLRKAIALKPDDTTTLNSLGAVLISLGNDEGIVHLRKAAELLPDKALYQRNLGAALADRNDLEGAEAAYRQALRVDPGLLQVHLALADLLDRRGKLAEAIEHYRQAVALQPEDVKIRYQFAVALLKVGRNAEAAGELEAVLKLDPSNVRAAQRLEDLRRTDR